MFLWLCFVLFLWVIKLDLGKGVTDVQDRWNYIIMFLVHVIADNVTV